MPTPANKNNDYQAVSCEQHSEIELTIIHGQYLQIQIVRDDKSLSLTIRPLDIVSRKGQGEFLVAEDRYGQAMEIRLDKIRQFKALKGS